MNDYSNKMYLISTILGVVGTICLTFGVMAIFFDSIRDNYSDEKELIYLVKNEPEDVKNIIVNEVKKQKEIDTKKKEEAIKRGELVVYAHIKIPTYNQLKEGYRLGCEGISLYMALKGLGYIKDYSVKRFMDTMPYGDTPYEGYVGNPTIGHYGENTGKRTTIYPAPLAMWADHFATGLDITGAGIEQLKKELDKGHVILAFVTTGWKTPSWKHYSWSKTKLGEVENNHCLCVVGYRSNGDFLVNDCHGKNDGRQGEYWVNAKTFAAIYNARQYAVSVY